MIADSSVGVSGSTNSARLNISEARIRGAGGFHLVHVNQDGPQLRLRAVNCTMQNCRFEDVNWDRSRGRLTLEDELILDTTKSRGHELVRIAYNRLTARFDEGRSYMLAEECFAGAMEVTRLNPQTSWWDRAWLTCYRATSAYGSNSLRALGWVIATWLTFGFLYALPFAGLKTASPSGDVGAVESLAPWGKRLLAGVFHSVQVSTLIADRAFVVTEPGGAVLSTIQPVAIAIPTALFLSPTPQGCTAAAGVTAAWLRRVGASRGGEDTPCCARGVRSAPAGSITVCHGLRRGGSPSTGNEAGSGAAGPSLSSPKRNDVEEFLPIRVESRDAGIVPESVHRPGRSA